MTTTLAKIGPIELTRPHKVTRDPQGSDGSRVIVIRCPPEEAQQLKGLGDTLNKSESGVKIVSSRNSRWGIMPVESPVSTVASLLNETTETHNGLMNIGKVTDSYFNPKLSEVTIEGEMISQNVNEILTILHSQGGEDGSDIEMSEDYSDLIQETILDEDFSDFDTTDVWEPKYDENMASGEDIVSSGGKLVFSGASATNWTWGYLWTILQDTVPDDFTAEFTLEWDALPASGAAEHHLNLFLVDGRPSNKTEIEYKDIIRIMIRVKDTGATLEIGKRVRGVDSALISPITLGATEKTPAIKFELSGGTGVSNLTVYVDKDYSSGTPSYGSPVFGPANTGVNFDLDRYLVLSQENASSTSATTRAAYLNIYEYIGALKPNTVILSPRAVVDQTATFTRAGEECNIQCIKDPSSLPTFQIEPEYFYLGSVKAWNGNYSDNTYRQITGNEFDLDPLLFYMDNTLIKLTSIANGVTFSYWNGTAWVALNTFTFPSTISLIRPFLVTPEVFSLQIDRTLWTMRAGKRHIWVKHPTTPLGFIPGTCYYHDGVTTTSENMLTVNQAGAETNTDGFSPTDGSTISNVTDWFVDGSKSLKCVTSASANHGVMITGVTPVPGVEHSFHTHIKADDAGKTMHLYMWDQDWNGLCDPVEFVTTGDEQIVPIIGAPGLTDTGITIGILNDSAEVVTFRIDSNYLDTPLIDTDISMLTQFYCNLWNKGHGSCTTPSPTDQWRMQIISPEPRTIKSDSIPAAELTGIGVYDSTIAAASDDSYLYNAREWFRPTWQRIILQSEV